MEKQIKLFSHEETCKPNKNDNNHEKPIYEINQKYKKVVKTSSKCHQDENALKYEENPGCSYHDPNRTKSTAESSTKTETDDDSCDDSQTIETAAEIKRNNNIKLQNLKKVSINKEIKSQKSLQTEVEEPIYNFKPILKDQCKKEFLRIILHELKS